LFIRALDNEIVYFAGILPWYSNTSLTVSVGSKPNNYENCWACPFKESTISGQANAGDNSIYYHQTGDSAMCRLGTCAEFKNPGKSENPVNAL
jgi:hypothetical protein